MLVCSCDIVLFGCSCLFLLFCSLLVRFALLWCCLVVVLIEDGLLRVVVLVLYCCCVVLLLCCCCVVVELLVCFMVSSLRWFGVLFC